MKGNNFSFLFFFFFYKFKKTYLFNNPTTKAILQNNKETLLNFRKKAGDYLTKGVEFTIIPFHKRKRVFERE